MPIHLAIARGHYFIVHQLLCQEQVVLYLMMMQFELYQCLKFAISGKSEQIIKLIYNVFRDQIDNVYTPSNDLSFWELSTFNLSDRAMSKS